MIISIKKNIVYETFNTKTKLQEKIITMICSAEIDNIIYKGEPSEIDFKTMRRLVVKKNSDKINPDEVREKFNNVVSQCDNSYCLIYKNKRTK